MKVSRSSAECGILVMTALATFLYVTSDLTPQPLPERLHQCFKRLCNDRHYENDPAETIAVTCLSNYMWSEVGVRCYNMSKTSLNYIGQLLLPILSKNSRQKRATPRVRKEYRKLSEIERKNYHKALNDLKKDTSVTPNKYNAIAEFHNYNVRTAAHNGPAFLPWHRIYLLILENALREKVPSVTIPYWDCSLDANMADNNAFESIMWSSEFMGRVSWLGNIKDGPLAEWDIPRDLGSAGGTLFSEAQIKEVLGMKSSTDFHLNIEAYHNEVHNWVGGHLAELETASFDPLFFMVHGFIDYLWWQWQTNNKDQAFPWKYPVNATGQHAANRAMLNLKINNSTVTNGEGYGRKYAFEYFKYEPRPSCSEKTCSGPYLFCISGNRCASRRRKNTLSFLERKKRRAKHRRKSHSHHVVYPDVSVEMLVGPYAPMPSIIQIPHVSDIVHVHIVNSLPQVTKQETNELSSPQQCYGFSIQNNFRINCEADSKLWAYIPVKVIHLRPPGKIYNSHLISRGKIETRLDMYSESHYKRMKSFVKPESPKTYEKCTEDDAGITKVVMTSQGLNYRGLYREYVLLDNRQAVDGKIGYLAFKRPDSTPSKFILTAFDQCGRICAPKCREKNSSPPRYKPCTGVFKIDAHAPRHYSDTYGEAVLRYWNFQDETCPTSVDSNIDVVFYCNYKSKWFPWY